jgi:hypothetical protein
MNIIKISHLTTDKEEGTILINIKIKKKPKKPHKKLIFTNKILTKYLK